MVEAAPNAMVMVDQTGKITLVNAQTEKLFGYGRDELLGQSVEFLVPERFRAAHPGHRARFFAEPSTRAMGAGREQRAQARLSRWPERQAEGQSAVADSRPTVLSVEDDGVGPSQVVHWDQGRSLGLHMVRDLTRQIRGTLEVRQNNGTTFALRFPVVKPRHQLNPQS